jgi:putative sigma-54 modulation protein
VDVQIKTKNIRLTDGLREYIQKQLAKLDRINERVIDAKLELRSEKNRSGAEERIAQFTIATSKSTLRTEEKNHDLRTAIDRAVDRMARQIKRFHQKQIFLRRRRRQLAALAPVPSASVNGERIERLSEAEDEGEVPAEMLIRRKRFEILPMGEDEAIEQMELLGHDFFVFFNPDDAQVNVLYRRRDGQYGVIQPVLA